MSRAALSASSGVGGSVSNAARPPPGLRPASARPPPGRLAPAARTQSIGFKDT
ncbi:hypothetical protein [Streptomyces sp. NPDC058066]|uniref:hypothetical protein n=1 Tax=Streptomyces sp. NPDC058066 TaxID=3346323 RepID=UPI0036E06A30